MRLHRRIELFTLLLIALLLTCSQYVQGQDTIPLDNPSFEAIPVIGNEFYPFREWYDCMAASGESPPDVHGYNTNFWQVTQKPLHGKSFLGMVTRENETTEIVSQRLDGVLKKGHCYELKIHLSSDPNYRSPTHQRRRDTVLFNRPIVLVLWGGGNPCEKRQQLDVSPPIDHKEWMEYSFKLQPEVNLNTLTLEVFYETPVLFPYCGNILVDHLSNIIEIPCSRQIADYPSPPSPIELSKAPIGNEGTTPYIKDSNSNNSKSNWGRNDAQKENTKKIPSTNEISGTKVDEFLKSDKELEIKNLAFEADSFNLKPSSYESLDQIYYFMLANPNISLEIGGHTNSLPPAEICDKLSLKRAQSVVNYLVDQGISQRRLKAVGYGKNRPLVSNKTITGRAKNQRVEIKIIKR